MTWVITHPNVVDERRAAQRCSRPQAERYRPGRDSALETHPHAMIFSIGELWTKSSA